MFVDDEFLDHFATKSSVNKFSINYQKIWNN